MNLLRRLASLSLLLPLGACGGGGGGGGTTPSSPPPGGGSNPCAAAGVTSVAAVTSPSGFKLGGLGDDRRDAMESLWRHRTRRADTAATLSTRVPFEDVGDIAVVRADARIISQPDPFDLKGKGLRFQPNGSGGYDVVAADATFRSSLGNRVTLGDDASTPVNVPFAFPFFGQGQSAAFVNSDGNVTFGAGDSASTDRGLGRLLGGAPRVAAFFADLDPSVGGGIFVSAGSSAFTVTWCGVPGFGSAQKVTAQTTLLPDGSVEMKFADTTTLNTAIVALSPGAGATFASVDLSASGSHPGGSEAVGQRFTETAALDDVALAQAFYQSHGDDYDQLVIFGDDALIGGGNAFAFESTVHNSTEGIGVALFDVSAEYGSGGALHSIVVMDRLGKYPDPPTAPFLDENSTVSILGQETGHQWLAQLRFRDRNGANSEALLGRSLVHWSFFFDSDASVMEGNDIQDLGGGSFRTVGAVSRYSMLDLYAMGVASEDEVPPFFYIENPSAAGKRAGSAPQIGVTITGTRRDVTIQDVIAVMGPRQPASGPRVHRQAFIFVVATGRDPAAEIARLDNIRQAWETFFSEATGGRMRVETRLQ